MNLQSITTKKQSFDLHAHLDGALQYIDDQWSILTHSNLTDSGTRIGLPHPYIAPSAGSSEFIFGEQYYWDTYFICLGLTEPKHQPLVEGMLDNLISLFRRFGVIPNASRMYFLSRSQPPLLTSLIMLIYQRYKKPKSWLKEKMHIAEQEYSSVWMCDKHPHWRYVHQGLSRYYDINVLHDLAEAESGWDMTTRFERKCLDYLPIDLNCYLYKYEMDFHDAAVILGDTSAADYWLSAAKRRRRTVNELLWSEKDGMFYDYNYQKHRRGSVQSLAAYTALWSGLASDAQAKKLVANLRKFTKKGGLATTVRSVIDMSMFGSLKTQWAQPNGWAPLHYFVCEGLDRYGYSVQASHIAKTWLTTNLQWYLTHHEFLEKYNVINPHDRPLEGLYPSQTGFGWTNGVFVFLAQKYVLKG